MKRLLLAVMVLTACAFAEAREPRDRSSRRKVTPIVRVPTPWDYVQPYSVVSPVYGYGYDGGYGYSRPSPGYFSGHVHDLGNGRSTYQFYDGQTFYNGWSSRYGNRTYYNFYGW